VLLIGLVILFLLLIIILLLLVLAGITRRPRWRNLWPVDFSLKANRVTSRWD